MCLPIIGNEFVFKDRHHLTMAFAKSLADALHRSSYGTPYLTLRSIFNLTFLKIRDISVQRITCSPS